MKEMFLGDNVELKSNIWALNLEPIIYKLMDEEEGEGWTLEQSLIAVEEYRRFLFLSVTSAEIIVPTKFVDSVWHTHILDTRKYMDDCQQLFGFYLHHFPYFGMRGEEDQANLQAAFKKAADVYEAAFNQPYYVGIKGATCLGACGPNSCGKCAGSGITSESKQLKAYANCDSNACGACAPSCTSITDIIRINERPSLSMSTA